MTKPTRILIFLSLICVASSSTGKESGADRTRQWFNVPWEVRYLLYVATEKGQTDARRVARLHNAGDGKNGKDHVYLDAFDLIKTSSLVRAPQAPTIATALINFDQQGNVVSSSPTLSEFSAKISLLNHLVLVRKSKPMAKPYELLQWSQGIPGNLSFGPSPCTMMDIFRYEDDWKSGRYPGDFGCREWTAQLFDDERPYIDVTTYTKGGNFIGQFVGWSRFKDAPKPVIGMNGKTWLCLHECPEGEQPGVIKDIKAWASKHRYPMPIRPAYQPEYPNKNYQDDLNEFWQD